MLTDLNKNTILKIVTLFSVLFLFLLDASGLFGVSYDRISGFTLHGLLISETQISFSALTNKLFIAEFLFLCIAGALLAVLLPLMSPIRGFLITALSFPIGFLIASINTEIAYISIEYCFLIILIMYLINILISYFCEFQFKQLII